MTTRDGQDSRTDIVDVTVLGRDPVSDDAGLVEQTCIPALKLF